MKRQVVEETGAGPARERAENPGKRRRQVLEAREIAKPVDLAVEESGSGAAEHATVAPREEVLAARDKAAKSMIEAIRLGRPLKEASEKPRTIRSTKLLEVLTYVADNLFESDLSVSAALAAADANSHIASSVAGKYLRETLLPYFQRARIETTIRLPDVLLRDSRLKVPTAEITAAVGLPRFGKFYDWHVRTTGSAPDFFVQPKNLVGLNYYTWNLLSRKKLPQNAWPTLRNCLAFATAHREDAILGHAGPGNEVFTTAKSEAVRLIRLDKALLPDDLKPLLEYIAENLFKGVNASEVVRCAGIADRKNASDRLKFYLSETVSSYIRKRWLETATEIVGESSLRIRDISKRLGQHEDTLNRWFEQLTDEVPTDIRRPLQAKKLVDHSTWRLARYGEPSAIRSVLNLVVVGEADSGDVDSGSAKVGLIDVASITWQPHEVYRCLRAAVAEVNHSAVNPLDYAQLALMAARNLSRKERSSTFKTELVALAELVFGLRLMDSEPSIEVGLRHIRAAIDCLGRVSRVTEEIQGQLDDLELAVSVVRTSLSRAEGLDLSFRDLAAEIACDIFAAGLLCEATKPDEFRWALAEKANVNRLATNYLGAMQVSSRIDLSLPFADMALGGKVHFMVAVAQEEAGDWEHGLSTLDEALRLFRACGRDLDATKVRNEKGLAFLRRGDREAFRVFRACFEEQDDPSVLFLAMVNMVTAKYYLSLEDELPFKFDTLLELSDRSPSTKAWIPHCRALMATESNEAYSLFMRAERDFRETMQILPATISTLFAATAAAKCGQISHARYLAIRAAESFRQNQAFGGRLALAAQTFLANLDSARVAEEAYLFLQDVKMPYLKAK